MGCAGIIEARRRDGERVTDAGGSAPQPGAGEERPAGAGAPRRTLITVALLVGTFLASIEVTVVATAMPSIVEQLGGLALLPWVFSAYLLAQTITIPLYGRMADLLGRRRTYVIGVSIFLTGSAISGMAPSMGALVAARALQGLGAGAVLPLTQTIFGDLYEVSSRTKMQGLFSLVWGVSAVVGPLTGGAIVTSWSWPWIFYLNLPFGLVSATIVGLCLEEQQRVRQHRIDVLGAVLLAGSTLLLLVALLPAEQRPLAWPWPVWLAASAAAFGWFVRVEQRHPEPLVPLRLFADRVQLAANASGVLMGVVLFGVVAYVPLYVQAVLGGSPLEAGAFLIPLSLGWTTSSVATGRLVGRLGFQLLVRTGCVLVAAGIGTGYLGMSADLPAVALLGQVVYGLGMGATISSFTVSVQERVPPHKRGIATALAQFSRSIGGAVGVAVLGAVLTLTAGIDINRTGAGGEATADQVAALARGLRVVFSVVLAAALLASCLGIVLFPRMTEGMRRRPPPGE